MSRVETSEPSGPLGAPWADASTWTGDGVRREVFFFRSGGTELYGSMFAAAEVSRPFGVVACGSWGVEADRSDPLLRAVALSAARLGGAALLFHYPGYGDSFGDLASVSLADLAQAACDAVAEGSRRQPGLAWTLAGFAFGASVACLAQPRTAARSLLLVQPALRPGSYFQRLANASQPLAPGPSPREMMEVGTAPGMAYGYPVPHRILERSAAADAAVDAAIEAFGGAGAVVRYAQPEGEEKEAPARFERIEAPGTWRFGSNNYPRLAEAAIGWLERENAAGDLA